MKRTLLLFVILAVGITAQTQPNGKGKEVPVLKEISGLEVIKSIYPQAASVEKVNTVWFKIVDQSKKVLGYTLSSKPFTEDIKGYHNTTPVIVVLDTDRVIRKVAILSHWETASYVRRLETLKYFDNWNGLTIESALKKSAKADSYSGATITASSLSRNLEIILKKAVENKF